MIDGQNVSTYVEETREINRSVSAATEYYE